MKTPYKIGLIAGAVFILLILWLRFFNLEYVSPGHWPEKYVDGDNVLAWFWFLSILTALAFLIRDLVKASGKGADLVMKRFVTVIEYVGTGLIFFVLALVYMVSMWTIFGGPK